MGEQKANRNSLNPMPTAAALRLEIERSLAFRIPAALSPVSRAYEAAPIGVPQLDGCRPFRLATPA